MALTPHDQIPTQVLDGAVKEYSRDRVYVLTALFLGAITVVEVLTYFFYAGLTLAVLVYIAVLSMFRIWFPGRHG